LCTTCLWYTNEETGHPPRKKACTHKNQKTPDQKRICMLTIASLQTTRRCQFKAKTHLFRKATACTHEEENGTIEEAPCDPPGDGLLGGVMVLPELDPIPPVELLLASSLADLMIGHATLPVHSKHCVMMANQLGCDTNGTSQAASTFNNHFALINGL